jgi:hydroxypyruvate isomerase
MNLFAGDISSGDRGVLSWPGREAELMASAELAVSLGERLGVRRFNVLYGNRIDCVDPREQDALAERQLREVARTLSTIGGVAMIEPVSGVPAYPIKTGSNAAAVVRRATRDGGPQNVGILLDLYHLAANGDDVDAAIEQHGATAAHVQLADLPGRGAPGSGSLPLTRQVARLRELGYVGWIALEYADTDEYPLAGIDPELIKAAARPPRVSRSNHQRRRHESRAATDWEHPREQTP